MRVALAAAVSLGLTAGCYQDEAEALARENAELRGRLVELEKRAQTAEAELAKLQAEKPAPAQRLPLESFLTERLKAQGIQLQRGPRGLEWSKGDRRGQLDGALVVEQSDTRGTLLQATTMKSYAVQLSVNVLDEQGVVLGTHRASQQVLGISTSHALKGKGNASKLDGLLETAASAIAEAVK